MTNGGSDPNFVILSVDFTNPANILFSPVGQIQLASNINGLALDIAGSQVFLATSLPTQEFISLNISDQTKPVIKTSIDLPDTAIAITYNGSNVFVADNASGQQLIIIGPGQW